MGCSVNGARIGAENVGQGGQMHDAEGNRRGTVGSGVSWVASKIRPANFQVNLRARIQDLNRRQGLPSLRCYAVASRGGTWC